MFSGNFGQHSMSALKSSGKFLGTHRAQLRNDELSQIAYRVLARAIFGLIKPKVMISLASVQFTG